MSAKLFRGVRSSMCPGVEIFPFKRVGINCRSHSREYTTFADVRSTGRKRVCAVAGVNCTHSVQGRAVGSGLSETTVSSQLYNTSVSTVGAVPAQRLEDSSREVHQFD